MLGSSVTICRTSVAWIVGVSVVEATDGSALGAPLGTTVGETDGSGLSSVGASVAPGALVVGTHDGSLLMVG